MKHKYIVIIFIVIILLSTFGMLLFISKNNKEKRDEEPRIVIKKEQQLLKLEEKKDTNLSPELQKIYDSSVKIAQDLSINEYRREDGSKGYKFEDGSEVYSLEDINRIEREKVLLKILNDYEYSNPKVASMAANNLMYNGSGHLVIPFLVDFNLSGNNKKYLNGRMGYGWLHFGNPFNIEGEVFTKLPGWEEGFDLYEWAVSEMNKEILNNLEKYTNKYGYDRVLKAINIEWIEKSADPLYADLYKDLSKKYRNMYWDKYRDKYGYDKDQELIYTEFVYEFEKNNSSGEMGKKAVDIFIECKNIIVNLSNQSCTMNFLKEENSSRIPYFTDCKKADTNGKDLFECHEWAR